MLLGMIPYKLLKREQRLKLGKKINGVDCKPDYSVILAIE